MQKQIKFKFYGIIFFKFKLLIYNNSLNSKIDKNNFIIINPYYYA